MSAYAQLRSASVTGAVMDQNGGIVQHADVKLTDQGTNVTATTKTNDSGGYNFPYLQAGVYTLSVSATGFNTYNESGIQVGATQSVKLDVTLKVGTVATSVDVAASALQLQTDSSAIQTAIDKNAIDIVANPTQNPLYYAMLQANVTPSVNSLDTTSINSFGVGINGRRQFSAIGVNGGKAFSNDIQVDGLPVMGGGYNEASVLPNTEGLSEVRVISNDFTAEYGHGQSAISMNTVSGTNRFHGQGTYTLRNEALMANTFSNNALNVKRPPFKVDEFGGALGGRIIRDKLFFFGSYHYLMHNVGIATLATVPTALERMGNFSQTLVADQSGNPIPVQIYNPYSVTMVGPQLYQRAPFPNAIIPNPSPAALLMMSYYPLPNRTPTNFTGAQNYQSTTVETVRRHNTSNRVDYVRGKQSFYGSGGLEYANVANPRPFGKSPVNGAPAVTKDKNPYGQIGDTIIVSPTLVVDVRYGYNRINTATLAGDKSGFTDYNAWGVPANVQSLMQVYGAAPWVSPGSPWTALTDGFFTNKRERQQSHNLNGSATRMAGKWTLKAGVQSRILLSNFQDLEEASTALQAIGFAQGGNFTFAYTDPNGNTTAQDNGPTVNGYGPAGIFTGAGTWFVRPGANVTPAFAQKYLAFYSQNDWHVSSRLTLNLGLRWDLQPGPTERYNRMSFYDITKQNVWGTMGVIGFPGTNGYGRNLWETEYGDIQPRLGAAYRTKFDVVLRGGFGITYLPSNTGYFSGPTDYGANSFSAGVNTIQYPGSTGIPAQFTTPPPLLPAIGANSAAPQIYGQTSSPLFDHFFQNGKVYQWNVFLEKQFFKSWLVSAGYSGTAGRHLITNNFAVQNLQVLDPSLLTSWHAQYVASNGTINPATQLSANPFQPSSGPLIPFSGALGQATLAGAVPHYPYPLLTANMSRSNGFSDYDSMVIHVQHRAGRGLFLDASYVWSKDLGFSLTDIADGQGFNPDGSPVQILDYQHPHNNRSYATTDVPSRFVLTAVYETPTPSSNRIVKSVLGHWSLAPVIIAQSGFPIPISGASTGSINGLPIRIPGVSPTVPEALQHWYNGTTSVTLPCGRVITPAANTYLKLNPCAFQGQVVTTSNGSVVTDQFWYGTAAHDYGDIRTLGRFNFDFTLRREFAIHERIKLQILAAASNLLNNTQFTGAFSGALGATNVSTNPTLGLTPGTGSGSGFGTMGYGTYAPRQVTMSARVRF
ncbi:MAG TPA: carboxypeptidase regulatory-like domain-containing protein [Bryobacteraceae bacterium]|nr:carboxypeptidase regulatory-like domain-containing protein [Bryobacteraceae bacterium]